MLYQIELFTEIRDENATYLEERTAKLNKSTKIKLNNRYEIKLNSFKIFKIYNSRPLAAATTSLGSTFTTFDCNFLRKEKLYTKLKYSRSPQYDIVSGGVAAIFSAFIGFLISEKFGIELVDSGDFYIVFMYSVFIIFSLKALLRTNSKFDTTTSIFNPALFINLLINLLYFLLFRLTTILNLSINSLSSYIRLLFY